MGRPIPVSRQLRDHLQVTAAVEGSRRSRDVGTDADPGTREQEMRMRQVLVYGFLGLYDGTILNKKETRREREDW